MKDKHHLTKHSSTVPYAIGIPELSQISFLLLARIYKLGIQSYVSQKLSDKTYGSVWLYALRFGNLLIIRHELLCQSPKISVSATLWKTHAKPASIIPSVSTGYFKKIIFYFLRESHSKKYNLPSIPEQSTITSHLGNVSKQLPFFGK